MNQENQCTHRITVKPSIKADAPEFEDSDFILSSNFTIVSLWVKNGFDVFIEAVQTMVNLE